MYVCVCSRFLGASCFVIAEMQKNGAAVLESLRLNRPRSQGVGSPSKSPHVLERTLSAATPAPRDDEADQSLKQMGGLEPVCRISHTGVQPNSATGLAEEYKIGR